MILKRRWTLLAILAAISLALAACGGSNNNGSSSGGGSKPTVRIGWVDFSE